MTSNSVAEVLQALAKGDKARSETARLRDVFGEVEAAINAGVSRAAILEALHEKGFTMAMRSFESALYRIRKERAGQENTKGQPVEKSTVEKPVIKPAEPAPVEESSKSEPTQASNQAIQNPTDLKRSLNAEIDMDAYTRGSKK